MSTAISVENVSKYYHLGVINRGMLVRDSKRWFRHKFSRGRSESVLEAEDKEKDHSLFWALKDVSFQIQAGDTFGIIGANGAGKSTLLKIISRITAPSSGKVRIKGRIGSLLEVGTGFHPELTGRENIYMNGAILGMNRNEVRAKFDEIVEFADIPDFIDTPVKRYSSGMYIRLAFSVSACLEPEILILDEILAVGDMGFRTRCFDRLESLMRRGHTILFVAHDMASVSRFCKKALWMRKGQVHKLGLADEVCEKYRKEQTEFADAAGKLDSSLNEAGVYRLDYEPGADDLYKVTEVRIVSPNGDRPGVVECGDPVEIHIQFKRLRPVPKNIRGFVIIAMRDEQSRPTLVVPSDSAGLSFTTDLGDEATIICKLPRVPLTPGTYRANISLNIDAEIACSAASAFFLKVEEGDFYGTGIFPQRRATPVLVDSQWRRA